jgi:uncharacterized cupin superfamily protein
MTEEARLVETGAGLVPQSDGWFVVNVRDVAWLTREGFGSRCEFEADVPAVRELPQLEPHPFPELGFKLAVLEPGQPSTLYHAETTQEDFLVLAGECLAIVEGEERLLRAWDFVHCPPGTAHAFVGAGDAPCLLLMTGARHAGGSIVYGEFEVARRHGAGVETETHSPHEAYAPYPHWQRGRPASWDSLPWTQS